jgi:hypothetical protein
VDDAGAVEGQRRDEATSHQVDEDRRQAGLDDMGAEAPDDRPPSRMGGTHGRDDGFEVRAAEQIGKSVGDAAERARRLGAREVGDAHLARPRGERIALQPREIEFRVRELHE